MIYASPWWSFLSWSQGVRSWSSLVRWQASARWSSSPNRHQALKCRRPFRNGLEEFGCGQCLPCRINRRRIWTHRLMLEARMHLQSCFVTLTYAKLDCNSDYGPILPTLRPRDLQLFLKRYRLSLELPIRFFAVGEYGSLSWRPHYHLALFGVAPGPDHGMRFDVLPNRVRQCRCGFCLNLRSAWPHGSIDVGSLTWESSQYMTGYMTKALTKRQLELLRGRFPEFTRMSLRPGIGALSVPSIGDSFRRALAAIPDVPSVLRSEGKLLPLGRYLHELLRADVGVDLDAASQARSDRAALELQRLQSFGSVAAARSFVDGEREAQVRRSELRYHAYRKEGSL